jgi:hypothetical protein
MELSIVGYVSGGHCHHANKTLGKSQQNSKIPEGRLVAGRRKMLVEGRWKFSW